jgi:hypothetical protein
MAAEAVTLHSAELDDSPQTSDSTAPSIAASAPRVRVTYEDGHLTVKPADFAGDYRPRSAEEVKAAIEALSTMFAGQPSLEDEYFRDKAIKRAKEKERDSRW